MRRVESGSVGESSAVMRAQVRSHSCQTLVGRDRYIVIGGADRVGVAEDVQLKLIGGPAGERDGARGAFPVAWVVG